MVGELAPREAGVQDGLVGDDEGGVEEAEVELDDLDLGDDLLERVDEAERGVEEVRVHDEVDERVDGGAKVGGAAGLAELEQVAPHDEDRGVVVDVQEGELAVVLLEDHDPRVEKVEVLGRVVDEHEPLGAGLEGLVQPERVGQRKGPLAKAPEHVRAQHHLRRVVHLHEPAQRELFPPGHELPQHDDAQQVAGHRRQHHRPLHEAIVLGEEAEAHSFLEARGDGRGTEEGAGVGGEVSGLCAPDE